MGTFVARAMTTIAEYGSEPRTGRIRRTEGASLGKVRKTLERSASPTSIGAAFHRLAMTHARAAETARVAIALNPSREICPLLSASAMTCARLASRNAFS
jgi:hypothetical protein